ncbi:MAG: helix-turn-helix domain-containing protein [Eikenella sp.]|nr:helix-turn-helix domain-containing protein [Eikenella sp.]
MWIRLDTARLPPEGRAQAWQDGIIQAYYALSVDIADVRRFSGYLSRLAADGVELSYLQNTPVRYVRGSVPEQTDEDAFLLALPLNGPICYTCEGHASEVRPGRFLLQHSRLPYTFACPQPVHMWVVKIDGARLRGLCRRPEALCREAQPVHTAQAEFLAAYLPLAFRQLKAYRADAAQSALIVRHLLELVALLLNESAAALAASDNTVLRAHLLRIQQYVREHLSQTDLTAAQAAAACRISPRYLHLVFRHHGLRFSAWLKEQRLQQAYALLGSGNYPFSLDFLAHRCGFGSTAYFKTQFRQRFQIRPQDLAGR